MEGPGAPVTFHDVAVYFSEEEWWSLEDWQRELYKEVMMDNIHNLSVIDSTAGIPEVLLKILMGSVVFGDYVPSLTYTTSSSSSVGRRTRPTQNTMRKGNVNPDLWQIQARAVLDVLSDFTFQEGLVDTGEACDHKIIMEGPPEKRHEPAVHEPAQPFGSLGFQPLGSLGPQPLGSLGPQPLATPLPQPLGQEVPDRCHEGVVCPAPSGNTQREECHETVEISDPAECPKPSDCHELERRRELEKCPEPKDSPTSVVVNKPSLDTADSGDKRYICAICGETFEVWKFLVRHFMVHGGMRPYMCPDCDKSFMYPSKLVTHQKTHTRPKSFSCPDCNKRFIHQSNLLVHQKTHCGQKPHVCKECGKSFMYPSKLLTHQKIHSSNKAHQCPDCGKSFVYRCLLLSHQECHSGLKPFQCSVCDKSFPRKSSLIVHLRRHTGERPYQCHICNRSFVEHAKLRRHVRIHTGERPYQCPVCRKSFNDSSTLNRHKRVHFPSEDCQRDFIDSHYSPPRDTHKQDGLLSLDSTPHREPQSQPMLTYVDVVQYIKSEPGEAANINPQHLKSSQLPQSPEPQNVLQPKHSGLRQYPKPPNRRQVKHSDLQHSILRNVSPQIKPESEELLVYNKHLESQEEHILKSPGGFQGIETEDEIVMKSPGSRWDAQEEEVLKWSVNNQEVKNENELALKCPPADHVEPPGKAVMTWTVRNQEVGVHRLEPHNEQVLKWTVDNQQVQTLNQHSTKRPQPDAHNQYKLKCLDCGLAFHNLSQYINHRQIHRLDKKARLSNRKTRPTALSIAEKLSEPSSMCRDLVLQNLDLITSKNTNSLTDFSLSRNEGKLEVSLRDFPPPIPRADMIHTQLGTEIQVVQLE